MGRRARDARVVNADQHGDLSFNERSARAVGIRSGFWTDSWAPRRGGYRVVPGRKSGALSVAGEGWSLSGKRRRTAFPWSKPSNPAHPRGWAGFSHSQDRRRDEVSGRGRVPIYWRRVEPPEKAQGQPLSLIHI